MPEIKNTFLKGKMNKDLDARLIPNGEYVDAQNIHITKSEGSDVGVAQNIKGNSAIGNISNEQGDINGIVIGYIAESESLADGSNRIFYFFKGDASDNSEDAIYYYNTVASAPTPIVKGSFLNFSASKLITGVNIIDGLLFWTDDNNQPRKINIQKAIDFPSYYDNEDKISVAKYYPYNSPLILHPSVNTQTGLQKRATTQSVVLNSTANITLSAANYDIYVGQLVSCDTTGKLPGGVVTVKSVNGTAVELSQAAIFTNTVNTYTDLNFFSQEDRLEEEFVKFAYRYKFSDGEYSVISPFTQTCFLPKAYSGATPGMTDARITDAAKTTEIDSMINDIGRVQMIIKLPPITTGVTTDYGITKIEILYKEAGNAGIKAVAEIALTDDDVSNDNSYSVTGDVFTYNYELTPPFKTLPEDQLTRVFDNVPRKAKSQEIAGNRLIYANFQENYNLPAIDFEAGYINRSTTNLSADQNWASQYPNQSVKSRRTYQIGIVLADKYGRQSPVILPDDKNKSSVRVPVHTSTPHGWAGYSLRVEFNDRIPDAYSSTNKFGWYSWRAVVKQTEQEYYNVYAPQTFDNIPNSTVQSSFSPLYFTDDDKRTWLELHGDNVNKVPKKPGVGGVVLETTSPSEASLFPVIANAFLIPAGTVSDPYIYNSNESKIDVISVGNAMDHGLHLFQPGSGVAQETDHTYVIFYNWAKNPLLAELPDGYGKSISLTAGTQEPLNLTQPIGLAIFETEPVKSALDIYFETSLTGLVTDLNTEIGNDSGVGGGPAAITIDSSEFSEGLEAYDGSVAGAGIIGTLGATNESGSTLSGLGFQINSAFAQSDLGTDLGARFDVNSSTRQLRIITNTFYYGASGESYNISITVTDTSGRSYTNIVVVTLTNADPTFSSSLATSANVVHWSTGGHVLDCSAGTENGSKSVSQKTEGLTYSIVSATLNGAGDHTSLFSITNTGDTGSPLPGLLKNAGYMAQNLIGNVYSITVKVQDAGHTTGVPSADTHTVNVTVSPSALVDKYVSSNPVQLCNPSTQTLYLTKPAANTGGVTIQVNDTIYTDSALTATFYGYILTQQIGGYYDQGLYAEVTGSGGTVTAIDQNRSCNTGP